MRALIDKGYAMAFESGVIAIRHWRVHNQIRRDRYTSTACVEMSLLVKDKKNVYQFQPSGAEPSGSQMETDRQPSVSQTETERQPLGNQAATQDRTGQDRIGKPASRQGLDAAKEKGAGGTACGARREHGCRKGLLPKVRQYAIPLRQGKERVAGKPGLSAGSGQARQYHRWQV